MLPVDPAHTEAGFGVIVGVAGGWLIVTVTSAVAFAQGALETVHLSVIGPVPLV